MRRHRRCTSAAAIADGGRDINYCSIKSFLRPMQKVFTLSHCLSPTANFIYAVCLGVYLQLSALKAHRQ